MEYSRLKAKIELLERNQRYSRFRNVHEYMIFNLLNQRVSINRNDFCSEPITYRHYLGEDLESMSLKELQNLEQHLDTALKHIRSRKVCLYIYIYLNFLSIYTHKLSSYA